MVWRFWFILLLCLEDVQVLPQNYYKAAETKSPLDDNTVSQRLIQDIQHRILESIRYNLQHENIPQGLFHKFHRVRHGLSHNLQNGVRQGLKQSEKLLHDLHAALNVLHDQLMNLNKRNKNPTIQPQQENFSFNVFKDWMKNQQSVGYAPAPVEEPVLNPALFESILTGDIGHTTSKLNSPESLQPTTMKFIPSSDMNKPSETEIPSYSTSITDVKELNTGKVQSSSNPILINYHTSEWPQSTTNMPIQLQEKSQSLVTPNPGINGLVTKNILEDLFITLSTVTASITSQLKGDSILSSLNKSSVFNITSSETQHDTKTSQVNQTQQIKNSSNSTENTYEVQTTNTSDTKIIDKLLNSLKNNSWLEQNVVFPDSSGNFVYLQTSSQPTTGQQIQFPTKWEEISTEVGKTVLLSSSLSEQSTDIPIMTKPSLVNPTVSKNDESSIDIRLASSDSLLTENNKLEDSVNNNRSANINEVTSSQNVRSSLAFASDVPSKYVNKSTKISNSTTVSEQDLRNVTLIYNYESYLQNQTKFLVAGKNNNSFSLTDSGFDSINRSESGFNNDHYLMNVNDSNLNIFEKNDQSKTFIRVSRSINDNITNNWTFPNTTEITGINSFEMDTTSCIFCKLGFEQNHTQFVPHYSENKTESYLSTNNSSTEKNTQINDKENEYVGYDSTTLINQYSFPVISMHSVPVDTVLGVQNSLSEKEKLVNVSRDNQHLSHQNVTKAQILEENTLKLQVDDDYTTEVTTLFTMKANIISNVSVKSQVDDKKIEVTTMNTKEGNRTSPVSVKSQVDDKKIEATTINTKEENSTSPVSVKSQINDKKTELTTMNTKAGNIISNESVKSISKLSEKFIISNLPKQSLKKDNSESKVFNKYKNIEFTQMNAENYSNLLQKYQNFLTNVTVNVNSSTKEIKNFTRTFSTLLEMLQHIRERYVVNNGFSKEELQAIRNFLKILLTEFVRENSYLNFHNKTKNLTENGTDTFKPKTDSLDTNTTTVEDQTRLVNKREIKNSKRKAHKIRGRNNKGHVIKKRFPHNIVKTTNTTEAAAILALLAEGPASYQQDPPASTVEDSSYYSGDDDYEENYDDEDSHTTMSKDEEFYDSYEEPSFGELISLASRHRSRKQKLQEFTGHSARTKSLVSESQK